MVRALVLGILIIVSYLLQTTVFTFIPLAGVVPNLLLVLTMSFGLMRGRKEGLLVGFFCGILVDLFCGFAIGPYAMIYMYFGYINGFFHRFYYVEDVLLPMVMIAANEFLYGSVVYVIFFLLRNHLDYGFYLKNIIVPEMIYTILVTLVLYKVYMIINRALKRLEEGSEA